MSVRLRVLVADSSSSAALVSGLLRHEGHRPIEVATGLDALEALASDTIELALLSENLPGLGATETIRVYRFGSLRPAPVFVMVAGDEEIEPALMEAGAAGLVRKGHLASDIDLALRHAGASGTSITSLDAIKDKDFAKRWRWTACKEIRESCNALAQSLASGDYSGALSHADRVHQVSAAAGKSGLKNLAHAICRMGHEEIGAKRVTLRNQVLSCASSAVAALAAMTE